ncbi:DNA-directed RNA polymerase subunit omega [Bacteroidales bacterium OttesenSCG-928-B11]|nr:DNA-directed RNA polymerase subunit omega [Bacteroidales bacterium OttesenSCG-928-B11]
MKSTDYKKMKIDPLAITRNPSDFDKETNNIYQSVAVMSKRSNQISIELKDEFMERSQEFAQVADNLEEVFENREQIELAKYFEQLPKPTVLAINEFETGEIYFREPDSTEIVNVNKKS